jgi:hypothetical protein
LTGSARRRDLATSAARALGDWAFSSLALETIFIDREPGSFASARVADRLGATLVGSRRVVFDGSEIKLVRHALARRPAHKSWAAAAPWTGGAGRGGVGSLGGLSPGGAAASAAHA